MAAIEKIKTKKDAKEAQFKEVIKTLQLEMSHFTDQIDVMTKKQEEDKTLIEELKT